MLQYNPKTAKSILFCSKMIVNIVLRNNNNESSRATLKTPVTTITEKQSKITELPTHCDL